MFFSDEYIIYLSALLATSTVYFCMENTLFFQYIMAVILLMIVALMIYETVSQNKRKKVLDKLLPELAKIYYKNKYNKDLTISSVRLNWAGTFLTKRYCNSGYIYLNEDETNHIFISLNRQYRMLNISDNLEDDTIISSSKAILDDVLGKYDVLYSVDLNKSNCNTNQITYNENLEKYFLYNNIGLNILIVKDLKEEFDNEYFTSTAKEISTVIKENISDNIFVKFVFTNDDVIYNDIKDSIDRFNHFDSLTLKYYNKFNLDNSITDNFEYLVISK